MRSSGKHPLDSKVEVDEKYTGGLKGEKKQVVKKVSKTNVF
jgi:hypothetical protein